MAKEKQDKKSALPGEAGQALAEAAMTAMYEAYMKEEILKNYLVDGAVLKCDKSTTLAFKAGDTVVELKDLDKESAEEKENRERTRLYVRKDDGKMPKGEALFATIYDCKQGALSKQADEEDKTSGPNIYPFRCNCGVEGVKETEEKMIKNNLDNCKVNGVCQYLMNLDKVWNNSIEEQGDFFEKRFAEDENTGVDADCIRMTSMLFCKRGGMITPVECGQEKTELSVDLNIIRDYLRDGVNQGEVGGALEDLARISGKTLPPYTPADDPKDPTRKDREYNQYDDLIIGWSEYYKYKYGIEIDPVIIKSQIYRESQMGYYIQTNENKNEILAANSRRDIMQALDLRNPNLYDYTELRPDQFMAGTIDYGMKSGIWIWEKNQDKEPPAVEVINQAKYSRCSGIVATLFIPYNEEGEEIHLEYDYTNVTAIMSIGIGMDLMMDLLKANGNDYGKALAEYNGSNKKEEYSDDIIERANNGEFHETL